MPGELQEEKEVKQKIKKENRGLGETVQAEVRTVMEKLRLVTGFY